ncbi:MAG: AraC family transcriptional regulator [Dongiaceae bacterium]
MTLQTHDAADPPIADPLSGLAPLLRVRPELQNICHFGAQWASPHQIEESGWAPFHLVVSGGCAIDVTGAETVHLQAGDVAVLPHGSAHVLRGTTTPPGLTKTPGLQISRNSAIVIKSNTDQPEAELVCGRLKFELAHQNLVLSALPAVIIIRTVDGTDVTRLRQLMETIKDELMAARLGAGAIAADLASALLVIILRVHFSRMPLESGLLGLLSQPQTARIMAAILEDPAKSWTLDALAAKANASRATLVRLFQKTAGMAPLEFLTELRLGLARNKLANTHLPLAEIAAEIGYQSESAFSRAFSRRFGQPPGEARRELGAG